MIAAHRHGAAPESASVVEARADIDAVHAQVAAAFVRGDARAVAALFTEDGQVIPVGGKGFVTGPAELVAYHAARFRAERFVDLGITSNSLAVDGDLAFEVGTYLITARHWGGAPATQRGRHFIGWRRQGARCWRIRIAAIVPDRTA